MSESTIITNSKEIDMENIKIVEIKVEAKPGGERSECLKEAMALAVKKWKNVCLIHNGKTYLVRPNHLINTIGEKGYL